MKVLSDIYTYSKDKSSVVFNAGESSKQKKNVSDRSWFSKTWASTPSLTSTSWFSKMSFPKYQMPKYSFPKCSSLNFSFPKCSFPKFALPTVWFKSLLVTLEETRVHCYLYLVELFSSIKQKSCMYMKCPCLQFNSNPEYVNYPWYKRVMFTLRDNIYKLINQTKESVHIAETEDTEEEDGSIDKKGSKAKVDEERTSRGVVTDDKYNMKHSQSSKYSNDLTTLRSSKKLKKTNTDDLKNGENVSPTIKNTAVFSMFSKSDVESKSPQVNSPVNKSGSLYVDANDDKYGDAEDNKNISSVNGEESIPGSNETSEERTKFNIKKTWDKFSKIIS